jgi:serine protease Do
MPKAPLGAALVSSFAVSVAAACLLILPACTTGMTDAAPDPSIAMLARVLPSVVRIEAIQLRPDEGHLIKLWTGGSGVIISPAGHVLTNFHVAEHADYFRCYLTDGTKVDARCVGSDPLSDIAVLQLDLGGRPAGSSLPVAAFGDSSRVVAGESVFALGSPGFLGQSATRGVVSNPSLILPEETSPAIIMNGENVGLLVRWIFHDARIYHGNSGGPLLNARGEVIGINEIGVFNLGGAIPGNTARAVADQLIAHGRVTRGWSGLTVQPRLDSAGAGPGVLVADVAPGSPAADAGFKAGDLILAGDGHPIEGAEEKAVSHFYRLETGHLPGETLVLDYQRGGQRQSTPLVLIARAPAERDDVELRAWGAVVRDITRQLERMEHLPDDSGVWLESIRPGGPSGQGEPGLRAGDILVGVDGAPVADVAALRSLTTKLLTHAPRGVRTVLASVRRGGAVVSSVVELRTANDDSVTLAVRKAWLGAGSQPLTPKLGARLKIDAEGGARLTRIFKGSDAEAAGLRVGDIVLAVDGDPVTARRVEDGEVFERQIRRYRPGSKVVFSVWRDGVVSDRPVTLEIEPVPAAEMPRWEDYGLEFAARDLAFSDRARLQLGPDTQGVLVENAVMAGWASLGGLHTDDVVLKAGGIPVASVAELHRAREAAVHSGASWWVLLVQRGDETLFVEINLKALKS